MMTLYGQSEAHKMPDYLVVPAMELCGFASHLCFHSSFVSSKQFKTWKPLNNDFYKASDTCSDEATLWCHD